MNINICFSKRDHDPFANTTVAGLRNQDKKDDFKTYVLYFLYIFQKKTFQKLLKIVFYFI